MCGRGKGRRHVGLTSVLVCLGAGGVFSDNSTEALKIRSIRVTREELRRDDEGVSIDHFRDGDIGVVFGSGSEAEENPGRRPYNGS